MKKYKVEMTQHQTFYAEVDAESLEQAEEFARNNLTPYDCEPDDYIEWEFNSAKEVTA
jgi:hypothetical protein